MYICLNTFTYYVIRLKVDILTILMHHFHLEMNVVEVETADPSLNLVVDNALDIAEEVVEDVEDVEEVEEEEVKEEDEEKENVEEEEGSGEEPVAEPEAEPEAESDSTKGQE